MMLENNVKFLERFDPNLLNNLKSVEQQLMGAEASVHDTSSGDKTLRYDYEGKSYYFNSKYDPINEADQWLAEYEAEMEMQDHVFFYGIGLGYHVERLMKRFPEKTFTLYEPNPKIFYQYLSNQELNKLPLSNLKYLYVDFVPEMSAVHVPEFINKINFNVQIIVHPAYTRVFKQETAKFIKGFSTLLKNKMTTMGTSHQYQRIWIINSLHNFLKIIETPNVLREKKPAFTGKPVILVSAGPSLTEEFENLRFIKENKLAYIFAVGSANRALINHGIMPDAITSYDPTYINYTVFEEIIDQQITDIPLIFGSSVNYKTVQLYPGPLLHMFINQDTISPFYLGETLAENHEILLDAPSIAVVTLELLLKLGASPIILVGQNFAYRNDEYFAQGINYDYRPANVTEQEKAGIIMVESVDGGEVATGRSHNFARNQMESYIRGLPNEFKIINTTKGGAKIKGAEFMDLESVIKDMLASEVVEKDWHMSDRTNYDWGYIEKQVDFMEKEHDKFAQIIDNLVRALRKMDMLVGMRSQSKLEKHYIKFDNQISNMLNNYYYRIFIRPMTRTTFEVLEKVAEEVRTTADIYERSQIVLEKYGQLIYQTKELYMGMLSLYQGANQVIKMTLQEEFKKSHQDEQEFEEQGKPEEQTLPLKG
jgi:hypothetical protein